MKRVKFFIIVAVCMTSVLMFAQKSHQGCASQQGQGSACQQKNVNQPKQTDQAQQTDVNQPKQADQAQQTDVNQQAPVDQNQQPNVDQPKPVKQQTPAIQHQSANEKKGLTPMGYEKD